MRMRRHALLACVGLAVLMIAGSGMGQRQALPSGKMYWTDLGIDKIQRVNLDGTNMEDLVTTGLIAPRGIALDVAGGKMYWTDAGSSRIQRATLDGTSVEDLITTYSSGPMGGGGKRYGIALATAR
jgi:DNA-binding beta-propeller fold protein YncE